MKTLAGVDGCPGGWIAAVEYEDGATALAVHASFESLLRALPGDAIVVVDMPIGLPEAIRGLGRAAETAVRPMLGARRSSLFAIPARAAVEAWDGPHGSEAARATAHARASALARARSEPARGVSRQGFMLFPKILEIDRLLRAEPALADRVLESHPEAAFAALNGGTAMAHPKKRGGRPNEPGLDERRALLERSGLPPALLLAPRPRGVGEDDRIDACAMLMVARAVAAGRARPSPDPPERDAHGLPAAIWLPRDPLCSAEETGLEAIRTSDGATMTLLPDALVSGYRSFVQGRYLQETQTYRALARDGQTPETMVIACCDSRAAPETIFGAGAGELFVVRNVANLVPPYNPDGEFHGTSAALEFAVQALKVKNIVVMGHGRCGGIKAALTTGAAPLSPGDFIGKWMSILQPVAETVAANELMTSGERQTALERISIRTSIANLRTFPYIAARERAGELNLYGAWFDISTAELWAMDAETGDFQRPLVDVEDAVI